MAKMISVTLAAAPEESRSAAAYGRRILHLAYRIDQQGRLIRTRMPFLQKGAIMAICHSGPLPAVDHNAFLIQLLREYTARGYTGVTLDFEGSPDARCCGLAGFLDQVLRARGIPLWVPVACAAAVTPPTRLMISSAISGGNYREMLAEYCGRYGRERLVLQAERNCEDFRLPAADGSGQRLSMAQLDQLFMDRLPTPFFSSDLCTYYFTYRDREQGSHFILFDNANSLRRKLEIAGQLGIPDAVLVYPEVSDIIRDILY